MRYAIMTNTALASLVMLQAKGSQHANVSGARGPQHADKAPTDGAVDEAEKAEETGESVEVSNEVAAAGQSVQTEGVRARRAFMLKQLLPSPDWINKNVVANGQGTRATVGRVFGVVTSTSRKTNVLPDGSTTESVCLHGALQSESYVTGEIAECSIAYLPMAYAEKLETLFKSDDKIKVIEVDCDIGLEATGKTIPYEWVIVAYREGEEMATMKRLKNSRKRPDALLVASGGKVLQIEGPKG